MDNTLLLIGLVVVLFFGGWALMSAFLKWMARDDKT